MTSSDELRQFMVAGEKILDRSMNVDELNHLAFELLQYYLGRVVNQR